MHVLLLTLALALPDPSGGSLESLQGTWHGDNDATVQIRDNYFTLTSDDGYTRFSLCIVLRGDRIRLSDEYSTTEKQYRQDGSRLWIGTVGYQRRFEKQAR
jgi:hypothetical protein